MSTQLVPSEEQEQATLVEWLELNRVTYCHVPNEGRHKVQYRRKMARLGLKSGVPDLLIFDPPPKKPDARGLAIELKRRRYGQVSANQKDWLDKLERIGWVAQVCEGAGEAIDLLESLGYGRKRR